MSPNFQVRKAGYFKQLQEILAASSEGSKFYQVITDAPFHDPLTATYLSLGIVEFLKYDDRNHTIKRTAISDTEHAVGAVRTSEKKFRSMIIPGDDKENYIAWALHHKKAISTHDWKDLFTPSLNAESARFNQAGAGVACSWIIPLKSKSHKAVLVFSFYHDSPELEKSQKQFSRHYTKLVAKELDKS